MSNKSLSERVINLFLRDYIDRAATTQFVELQNRLQKEEEERQKMWCEMDVGKPVIAISNEWRDPTVGVITSYDYVTKSDKPIPVIYDYVTMEIGWNMGAVYEFTAQRLDALLSLTPSDRWALMVTYGHRPYKCNPAHAQRLRSKEEIYRLLIANDFFTQVNAYNAKQDKDMTDNAVYGSKHLLHTTDLSPHD